MRWYTGGIRTRQAFSGSRDHQDILIYLPERRQIGSYYIRHQSMRDSNTDKQQQLPRFKRKRTEVELKMERYLFLPN